MGKKHPFEHLPLTHSEWEEWVSHREFQQDWHPYCRQTMRRSKRGQALIWEEDYYLPERKKPRSWKAHRKTQYKTVSG